MSIRPRRVALAAVPLSALALSTLVLPVPAQSQPTVADSARSAPGNHGRSGGHAAKAPTRVVQIVLDQLRPEFIDAFDMKNVKALMRGGASFKHAYLGHMASETVVSHNVMTSGMLPKHMGWSDEWYRDAEGVLGTVNGRYVTGSMSQPRSVSSQVRLSASRSRCSGVRRCHSSPKYSSPKRSSSTPRSIRYDHWFGRSTSIWSSGGGWIP